MATITRSRLNEIIKEEYEKLIELREGKSYTVMAIKNNKVVDQFHTTDKKEIDDVIAVMKKDNKGSTISVENPDGKIIKVVKEGSRLIEVSRGSMKTGKTYTQTFDNGDKLYFRPTDTTNNGVKGILYTVYAGKKVAGKNPKKYSVTNLDMDLWSDASNVPSSVDSKLK